ncbi:septal ring lytic transglycosylase RlpA family protein [Polaromonas sp. P1-6]|nr:septal ring lytic transglycosylase RlpA family protein [Polaromonas sp. P1-6]
MCQGVVKVWGVASLLAVLTACTTVPLSPHASPQPSGSPSSSVPVRPVGKGTAKPETSYSIADPTPVSGLLADDNDLLAGEAAKELERGQASWYGPGFHGRRTASGERYDMYALTAAHKTLPFGTLVRVRSLVTGREVEVRINDRGPFSAGRVIDVSQAAAAALGMLGMGVKDVLLLVPESIEPVAQTLPTPRKNGRQTARPKPRRASPGRPR